MPLTVAAIQAAKPRQKPYKLFDQGGLFQRRALLAPQVSNAWAREIAGPWHVSRCVVGQGSRAS